ncbi:putative RNA-directed DNA polymerase from transposon X-element, partial [Schistosoma japonicum]
GLTFPPHSHNYTPDGLLGYPPSFAYSQRAAMSPYLITSPVSNTACSDISSSSQTAVLNHHLVTLNTNDSDKDLIRFFTIHSSFLNFLVINARSLLNKISTLKTIALLAKPLLIFVTETWCSSSVTDSELAIQDYMLYRGNREYRRGGGCLIYVSVCFSSSRINDEILDKVPESVWISLNTQNYSLLFGCIYRTPNTSTTEDNTINNAFVHTSALNYNAKVIAGDFNLPRIDWNVGRGLSYDEENLLSTLEMHCWTQCVHSPTRYNNILDLVFCHDVTPLSLQVSKELETSDHKMILCALPFNINFSHPNNRKLRKKRLYRDYKNVDWNLLHALLSCSDWDNFFLTNNLTEALDIFYQINDSCLDSIALIKISNIIKSNDLYIPLHYRKKLRRLQKCYFKSNDFSAFMEITMTYNQLKEVHRLNAIKEEVSAMDSSFKIQNLVRLFNKRLKPSWNSDIPCILRDGILINDHNTIVNLFSDFFADRGKPLDDIEVEMINSATNYLESVTFTYDNICKSIKSLRASSSSGVDGLASIYFKLGGPNMPLILLRLFDLPLTAGTYPSRWKISYICPHFKSGDRTNLHNYRPINITPVISRIMEKIVCDKISDHLLSEKLISNFQHGLLKTRSCMTCHFEFLNLIFTERSLGHLVLVLYLDISKAFDMVNHRLLMGELSSYGIKNPLLAWLNSFLSHRHQIVKINSTLSKAEPDASGVIQGTVLGPLLFIAYVNDICKCFSMEKPFLYADDLKIVYSFPPLWCSKWKLDLNASKCGWICFGDKRLNFDLFINSSKLSMLQSVVDLGLRYSYDLSFTEQVNMQTSQSHRLLGCIIHNFHSNHSHILLYKVCVRPLLEYCTFILSNVSIKSKLKL